jgi:hypothetical protein
MDDMHEQISESDDFDNIEEQAQIDAHRTMLENTNAWFFEEMRKKQQEVLKKRMLEK